MGLPGAKPPSAPQLFGGPDGMPVVFGICHWAAPAPAHLSPMPGGHSTSSPEPHSPESPWGPHLVDRTWGTSWAKESFQEGLEGIFRGQGGSAGLGLMAHLRGDAKPGGVGERQSRATARECQMLLGCELGSCESRSVQSHLERGERRGGLFPRLNLVGFSYSRFRIWAANWCSFGTGGDG